MRAYMISWQPLRHLTRFLVTFNVFDSTFSQALPANGVVLYAKPITGSSDKTQDFGVCIIDKQIMR